MLDAKQLIREVVLYEMSEQEENDWDVDATVELILPYLEKHLRNWRVDEDWRFSEAVHIISLDWFSSYEPVTKGRK